MSLIKKFLEQSFINFIQGPYQGEKMVDEINPLAPLWEDYSFTIRIYKEGFLGGLWDTYNALVGNHYDFSNNFKGRKGFLDLLIFPLIGRIFLASSFNQTLNTVIRLFAFVLGIVLEIPRNLSGLVLTLVLTPVVAAVHAYFYWFKIRKYVNALQTLECIKREYAPVAENATAEEIAQSITEIPVAIDDVPPYRIIFPKGSNPDTHLVEGEKVTRLEFCRHATPHMRFFVPLKLKNREGIIALIALNIGVIRSGLALENGDDRLQQWIETSPHQKEARQAFLMSTKTKPGETPNAVGQFVKSADKNLLQMIFEMADMTEEMTLSTDEDQAISNVKKMALT